MTEWSQGPDYEWHYGSGCTPQRLYWFMIVLGLKDPLRSLYTPLVSAIDLYWGMDLSWTCILSEAFIPGDESFPRDGLALLSTKWVIISWCIHFRMDLPLAGLAIYNTEWLIMMSGKCEPVRLSTLRVWVHEFISEIHCIDMYTWYTCIEMYFPHAVWYHVIHDFSHILAYGHRDAFYIGYLKRKWNILFIVERNFGKIIVFNLLILLATSVNDLGFHWYTWKAELFSGKLWISGVFHLWITSYIIVFTLLRTVVGYWCWTRRCSSSSLLSA